MNFTYPLSGYGVNDVMSSATHPSRDKRWAMLGISALVGGKPVLSIQGVIDINYVSVMEERLDGGFTIQTVNMPSTIGDKR